MTKYITPEYGKEVLSKIFKEEVEIRDYSKIEHCKDRYPQWGIMVLAYSSEHKDLYARISYLPSNETKFSIELDDYTWMESKWKNEEVDDSAYDYFTFIIKKIMSDFDEYQSKNSDTISHTQKFESKYWLKRQKKIDSII